MNALNIISKAKREELVAKIEPLRQRVETWRKTRVRNEHMPEPLWLEATELAKSYGVAAVQGILRIDYCGLKRRALGIALAGRPKPSAAGFVELHALSPGRRAEHTIELEDGAGRKMTVKVSGGNLAELVPLAQAFWRPGA
jgi:hypothetical protein